MAEWVFLGGLPLAFLSLIGAIFLFQWRETGQERSAFEALPLVLIAVVGAILLMVPLFYLVYVGMIPKWRYRVLYVAVNALLPMLWAHLAVFAWGTGRSFWERYALGIAFFLTVPVLFLGIWMGALLQFRYSILVADWLLFIAGLTLWRRARRVRRPEAVKESS